MTFVLDSIIFENDIRVRLDHLRKIITHFQTRFYKEYVVALRERHFYNANIKYDNHCDIKVGDVLLIKQDKIPRMCWKKGKVESLIIGTDGYVRGAVLRTHQKKVNKTSLIKRPLQYLIPLEITSVTGDENARETLENEDEMNRNRVISYNELTVLRKN